MWQIAKVILTMKTVFMSLTAVRNRCAHLISTLSTQKHDDCEINTVILMKLVGAEHVSAAAITTAKKQLFLFKREFQIGKAHLHDVDNVLSALDCAVVACRFTAEDRVSSHSDATVHAGTAACDNVETFNPRACAVSEFHLSRSHSQY